MVDQVNHKLIAFRKFENEDNHYLKAAIDEVLIIEKALTETQVKQLYQPD